MRQMLEGGVTPRIPKAPKPTNKVKKPREPLKGCTLEEISSAKNLPLPFLLSLGWRDSRYAGVPAVAVPWPGGIHYRVNLDANPKYLWRKGDKVSILGIERLEEVRRIGWVLFVEGDTDYAAGRLMGLPVMAVPGASTWKADWALQFQGCQIYVWKEPDSGGENLVGKLRHPLGLKTWPSFTVKPEPGLGNSLMT
jgi:hypothetical protein